MWPCACRFVLVEEPDITGIPAFTQHSTYGYYPVIAPSFCTFVSRCFMGPSHATVHRCL